MRGRKRGDNVANPPAGGNHCVKMDEDGEAPRALAAGEFPEPLGNEASEGVERRVHGAHAGAR
jgi:hypothetical protein